LREAATLEVWSPSDRVVLAEGLEVRLEEGGSKLLFVRNGELESSLELDASSRWLSDLLCSIAEARGKRTVLELGLEGPAAVKKLSFLASNKWIRAA
jgi:hypothetical protein